MDVIEFKPSQLSVTLIKIYDNNVDHIKQTLAAKLAKAGKFLRGASVVLLPNCALSSTTLARIIELLRQYDMVPIGIHTDDPSLMDYAELSGLVVLNKVPETTQSTQNAQTTPPSPPAKPSIAPLSKNQETPISEEEVLYTAKQITQTLRSGQTAQYLSHDVVVRGSINSGAEVFAGGHLTIYGAVRGRVHAGATGNQQSRIVAYNFNPELVSIAGVFLLSDDIPKMAKQGWIEISLENQRLKFTKLNQ